MTRHARIRQHVDGYIISFPGTPITPQTAPDIPSGIALAHKMAKRYRGEWSATRLGEVQSLCEAGDEVVEVGV